MTYAGNTLSGRRIAARKTAPDAFCAGCGLRRTIGYPRADDWSGSLHTMALSQEQVDLILRAAREFDELTAEAMERGEMDAPPSFIAFVDWLTPDLLGHPSRVILADGAHPRNESGGMGKFTNHRHPDPIPWSGLPPKIRGAA